MAHTIELSDLQEWIEDNPRLLFASASGNGSLKRLYATISGGFEVELNSKVVWAGMQPFNAVEEYNKI